MRWMTRQFSLPILLGISLTSVSIAILYVLYKKDEEDIKSRKNHVEISKRFTAECKVPRQFVPAVIGRGGSMIKDIQNKTGTQIHFKEDNIDCPDRICIIKGSYEGVHLAEEMIKSVIQNQPIIETYEMYVPQKACGRIIGRGGEVIHQIQATSSAKIIIESSYTPYDPNAERRIIIKGTAEQIATALLQIEDKVREEKEARTKLEASSASRLPRGKLSPRNTKNNIQSEQVQTTELLPVSDGGMEVYISAMETPSQFWVQVVGPGTTALDKLVSDMTVYYNDEKNHELHKLRNITLGQIVAAKFSFNEQWYRAEVISAPEDGQCEVYFVDYGDREMVQLDCILELRTDFLSLRLQAIECSLANIKPRDNEWSVDACNLFAEFTCVAEWIVLTAKVRGYKERSFGYGRSRREGSPIPCVDLFCDTTVNVGQELINEGFADLEENLSSTASSTLSLSNRSHEVTAISTPTSTSPLAKRALSPEMLTDTPNKLDSISELQNTSIIDLKITSNIHGLSQIEEIDLVTPQKPSTRIEEIDLVTPVKDETKHFIENEKKVQHEDGRGDYLRNGNSNQYGRSCNSQMKVAKYSPVAPAGYESDISDDSGEMELG